MQRNIALGVVILAAASFAAPRVKADATFTATLSGTNEVPPELPAVSPATGSATVTLTGSILTVNETFAGLIGGLASASTIQVAPVGSNGPAAVLFVGFPAATSGTYTMTFDLTLDSTYISSFLSGSGGTAADAETALQADLLAGQTYLNIHDATFPGGEIRGQLSQTQNVTPEPGTILLFGTGLLGMLGAARRKRLS
jgi:hypothetical protein